MARAGAVWVDVLPSMAGFQTSLRAGLRASGIGGLGQSAGREYGQSMSLGVRSGLTGMRAAVKAEADAAAAAVRVASREVAAARDVEAKAAGAVRVAELKLQETRAKAGASASQVAAAEERLATANRSVAAAAGKASVASDELATAQSRAGESSLVAGGRIGGMATAATGAGRKISESMAGAGKAILGLGAIGAGIGGADFLVKGVENATKFQTSMNLLVTAGGEAPKALGAVAAGVQKIAMSTGTGLDQLGEGMYTLEKAGLRGASGLKVLQAAAQGAKAENVDLGTMTNALTSIMRSYNLPASQAVSVTNQLVAASGRSKTTMQEFAGSLSSVLPIASAAHISFAEVGGAVATLTQHGTSADEATQHLAFTIRALQAPNAVASKAMAQLGIASNDVATGLGTRGLQGTIDMLSNTILSKMGKSGTVLLNTFNQSKIAAQNAETMFKALPADVQSAATAFMNGSISLKTWNGDVKYMTPAHANLAKQWATMENNAKGFQQALRSGTPQAVTYTAELKAMLGGAVGLNTGLQLTGGSAQLLTANTKAIAAAARNAGANVSSWGRTQSTFRVQMDRFKTSVNVAGVQVGTVLLPPLTKFVGWLANGVPKLQAFTRQNWSWLKPVAIGIGAIAVAIGAASAAMSIFALVTSPIGLVVLAIGALTAAFVLSYKHSETFRAVVQSSLHAVEVGARAVGAAGVWLWQNALQPAFKGIATAATVMWQGGIQPAFRAISDFVRNVIAPSIIWWWHNVTEPAFHGMAAVAKVWWNVTSAVLDLAATVIRKTLGPAFTWLYTNVVKPAWQGISAVIGVEWKIIRGVFDVVSTYITTNVAPKFKSGVSALGTIWSGLQKLAETPIRFVIDTVLNKGLISAFNWVAGKVGSKTIAPIPLPFATGGRIPGTGGPTADDIPIWASSGEYMVNAKSTRKHHALLEAINGDKLPGYSIGGDIKGIAGKIGHGISDIWSAITNPVALLKKLAGSAMGGLSAIEGNPFGQLVGAVPTKLLSLLADKVKSWVSLAPASGGGGGNGAASPGSSAGQAQGYARSQLGRFGWDASQMSPLIALWNQESGWNYRATNPTSGAYGIPQSLPASKMASAGSDYLTNPATQINWGLDYIKGRYGSPAGAEAHELSSHWYANGGPISGAGGPRDDRIPAWLSNGEYVINAAATARHRPLLDAVNAAGYATGGPVTSGGSWNDGWKHDIKNIARHAAANREYLRENAAYSRKIAFDTAAMKVDQAKVATYTARLSAAQSKLSSDQQASSQYASGLASSLTGAAGIGGIFSTLQAAAQARAAARSTAAQAATSPQALGVTGSVTAGLSGALGGHTVGAMPTGAIAGHTVTAAPVTARGILSGLKSQLYQIVTFQKALNSLRKRGIAPSILDQIAQAGVAQGLPVAKALLTGSASDLAGINSAQAAITKYSQAVGNSVAQAIYGPTIKADQQAVASLTASLAKWTAALKVTAADLAKQKSDLNETPAQRSKARAANPPSPYRDWKPPRITPIKLTPASEGGTSYTINVQKPNFTVTELEALMKRLETKNRSARLVSR